MIRLMPIPFTPNEMIACERCGAYLPKRLAEFHRCPGSDKRLRPANVPLERWLRTTNSIEGWIQHRATENWIKDLKSMQDDIDQMIDSYEHKEKRLPFQLTVFVGMVVAVLITTVILWFFFKG